MDLESPLLAPSPECLAAVKVFPLIPALKKDVNITIGTFLVSDAIYSSTKILLTDSYLSWDQLTASDVNFAIVRPLVLKYARLQNMSVVYACLVVRSYYQDQIDLDLAYAGVMQTRAMLCEVLAMKLLTHFASNHIQLVAVLTTCWNLLAGAPTSIVEEVKLSLGREEDDLGSPQSALEMAISTNAKSFVSTPLCQNVVHQIYSGDVVFSVTATRSVLADNYKPRSIKLYNPSEAPFLDHYRLRVPKYRVILEFLNFSLLLLTFVLCLFTRDLARMTIWEIVFIVFAIAFVFDEYTAVNEYGWIIYIANMWNVFDFSFIVIFLVYLVLRLKGLNDDNVGLSGLALDILACGACILLPRLAFFTVSNNVVVLSLRAMISEFVFFIGIAAISFSGLLFALWTLAKGDETAHQRWDVKSIAWLMVQIWFGNTSLSFAQATSFHPVFGPILMTIFAALSNTLLLTIMISVLSNTAATISDNATQEYMFQFAIKTIQRVTSDALFSYQPPFNILAFVLLKPASWILSPRALHSSNVFLIRLTSLPILLVIGTYERFLSEGQVLRERGNSLLRKLPRRIKNMPLLVGSKAGDLHEAIFDVDTPEDVDLFDEVNDEQNSHVWSHRESLLSTPTKARKTSPSPGHTDPSDASERSKQPRLRVHSMLPPADSPELAKGKAQSPLARFFTARTPTDTRLSETTLKKIESLIDEVRDLPIQRLKDEMKELQERQSRIENLLLVLTRGMRNETPSYSRSGSSS